jgi:tyrosinase
MFSNNITRFLVLLTASIFTSQAAHAQYYAITGVKTGISQAGARPARRNLLEMQKDTPTW